MARPRRTMAPTLTPITTESVIETEENRISAEVEEKKQELLKSTPPDAEHFIDEMTIDKYIDRATEDNEILKAEFEVEKNELLDRISRLETEKKRLEDRISDLEKLNRDLESKLTGSEYTDAVEKMKRLDHENDELLLKNSELMFNNSKFECMIKDLQAKLDHQYHYTKTPPKMNGSPFFKNQNIAGSMNGYQEWRD